VSEQHTPGPWIWDRHHQLEGESESLRPALPSRNLVLTWSRARNAEGVEYTYILVGPADKPLIAAAPDLLRELEGALETLDTLDVGRDEGEGDPFASIRAAIAKAQGRT